MIEAYCQRPLPRYTRHTISERGTLLRELDATTGRVYALTNEEMTLVSCSVAVPVPRPVATPAVSLGVVVHSVRADLPRLAPRLSTAAEGIASKLRETADDPAPGFLHNMPALSARTRPRG